MKTEQQRQAESLYFQTDLSKTEIASMVGISRRTLHYWVQQNHWDAIKQHAAIMPTALAGNCYLIMADFLESLRSHERAGIPATMQEINTLHRLTNTICKLTKRATLNESLEMMTHFMEFAAAQDPRLIDILQPVVDGFIRQRAGEASMLTAAAHALTTMVKPDEPEEPLDEEYISPLATAIGEDNVDPTTEHTAISTPVTIIANNTGTTTPHISTPLKQNVKADKPGHIIKGKANNRAARRAQSQAAARQARAAA